MKLWLWIRRGADDAGATKLSAEWLYPKVAK